MKNIRKAMELAECYSRTGDSDEARLVSIVKQAQSDLDAIERRCDATTLRDTFAAAALTGILSANEDITHRLPDGTRTSVGVARLAYGMADAMLAAREGK